VGDRAKERKMAKRFTDTNKYKDPFIRGLQGAYKLLWDYLQHDCDHAGIWHVDFEVAQIYIGKDMPVNEQEALNIFNQGENRIFALEGGSKWFVKPFVEFQYGVLNRGNRVHDSVILSLERSGANKALIRGLQGDKDIDIDKDKEKKGGVGGNKRFQKPTLDEVSAYCLERGNSVNPKAWMDHYTSNGWKIGKTPMKDWKAAVRTWERNGSFCRIGDSPPMTDASGRELRRI